MELPMLVIDPLRLRQLRKEKGWTQKELAKRAGTSDRTVVRLEASPREDVTFSTANGLSRALGVPPWSLLKDVLDP